MVVEEIPRLGLGHRVALINPINIKSEFHPPKAAPATRPLDDKTIVARRNTVEWKGGREPGRADCVRYRAQQSLKSDAQPARRRRSLCDGPYADARRRPARSLSERARSQAFGAPAAAGARGRRQGALKSTMYRYK
ncbi:hypothetical protein EVAR_103091_1 [Eumeta japonica]|uniref:Uncharacterized protein n=1 Tax=Eumeta variegata TaxID=151549 RepID=A0A4C1WMH3_EUMVA|nr:hypothetical protein EVAR_103091_1 [Eumeta japonica]